MKYSMMNRYFARGYSENESGQLTVIRVRVQHNQPVDTTDFPLNPTGEYRDLVGWPDARAEKHVDGFGGEVWIGVN